MQNILTLDCQIIMGHMTQIHGHWIGDIQILCSHKHEDILHISYQAYTKHPHTSKAFASIPSGTEGTCAIRKLSHPPLMRFPINAWPSPNHAVSPSLSIGGISHNCKARNLFYRNYSFEWFSSNTQQRLNECTSLIATPVDCICCIRSSLCTWWQWKLIS